jgi:hypothetical protein
VLFGGFYVEKAVENVWGSGGEPVEKKRSKSLENAEKP